MLEVGNPILEKGRRSLMQLTATTPQFATAEPSLLHFSGSLRFSLPLLNIGKGVAELVYVDRITLNNAPAVGGFLPRMVGTLREGGVGAVNGRFASAGLLVGGKYTLSVRGRYRAGGVTSGFIVNRAIVVPPSTQPPLDLLRARVDHFLSGGLWSYVAANEEPVGSDHSIVAFSLDVVAPVQVMSTPVGWEVLTDNAKYVLWHTDPSSGYQIRPGAALGVFAISSPRLQSEGTAFSLAAWNYTTSGAGRVAFGATASPARG